MADLGRSDRTEFRETGREFTDDGRFSTGYEKAPKKRGLWWRVDCTRCGNRAVDVPILCRELYCPECVKATSPVDP
jgi:hypothetical protein